MKTVLPIRKQILFIFLHCLHIWTPYFIYLSTYSKSKVAVPPQQDTRVDTSCLRSRRSLFHFRVQTKGETHCLQARQVAHPDGTKTYQVFKCNPTMTQNNLHRSCYPPQWLRLITLLYPARNLKLALPPHITFSAWVTVVKNTRVQCNIMPWGMNTWFIPCIKNMG